MKVEGVNISCMVGIRNPTDVVLDAVKAQPVGVQHNQMHGQVVSNRKRVVVVHARLHPGRVVLGKVQLHKHLAARIGRLVIDVMVAQRHVPCWGCTNTGGVRVCGCGGGKAGGVGAPA